jgi:hypothetical protein
MRRRHPIFWRGLAATLAFALVTSGCGTMMGARPQRILVSTYPSGAQCILVNRGAEVPAIVAMTPGEVEVQRSPSPLEVHCTKYGHLDASESYESFAHKNSPTTRRQVVAAEALLRDFVSIEIAQSRAKEEVARATVATGVATVVTGAVVALPITAAATVASTMAGGAALTGAGVVAAPLLVGVAVLAPVALVTGMADPAVLKYPATVMLILPPMTFADESARDAYYVQVDRQFDRAREALRMDTASQCILGCDLLSREDDTYIATWRSQVASTRSKTTVAASNPTATQTQ